MKRNPDEQPTPAPYLNRRDQIRMLAMVGLLCLVMIAIKLAARPESWHWLLPPNGNAIGEDAGPAEESVTLKELDFRVKSPPRPTLKPGEFRAVANVEDAADELSTRPEANSDDDTAAPLGTTVPPDLLKGVEDNTMGVRSTESDAYHQMLDRARRLPIDVLAAHADSGVAFTVVMLNPDDYRGRLIEITGWLHRIMPAPVMKNDVGIDELYEAWIFTDDSGNNPWQVICTKQPDGIAVEGEMVPVKVRTIGYFFKRTGYASQGGQHVAPTLLAQSLDVLPAPVNVVPQMQAEMRNWLLGFVGLIIAGLALLIWRFAVADRKFAGSRVHQLTSARLDADPDDLAALANVETSDPNTLFRDQTIRDQT